MAAGGRVLPEGLNGQCPYTLLGLCISEDGQPTSVHEAADNEASVESREQLSLKAIGTAYRKAALKSHPDKNKGREQEAASNFVQVNLAFAFLSDKAQRDSYHRHLRALLGLRLQREHHRQRWTQQDRERQRFKEELERREAEARNAPQQQSEEETLRQIREQNEQLLRKKQQEIDTARRQRFRNNLLQQQKQQQPASHIWEKAEAAEEAEDILYRSLLLSWPSAAKSETGVSEGKKAGAASGDFAAHPTELPPSPASLASQLWMHGAVDLCFFSKARGLACVSFTSRERAIESALLLQKQQKTNSSSSKTQCIIAKLANKTKDHLALLHRVLRAADASEQEKPDVESAATEAAANTKIEDEIEELARETEEAATAFAAALAAVQGNNTRKESPAATKAAATETAATAAAPTPRDYSSPVSGVHEDTCSFGLTSASLGGKSAAEARAATAAFGLGSDQMAQPTSCAAARMLAYIRACNERGSADVRERQAEIDHEKGWEWLGGSKVAANMSLEQLEAAAFGALERKKQQLKRQE